MEFGIGMELYKRAIIVSIFSSYLENNEVISINSIGGFRPTTCENSEQIGNIQLSCRYLTTQDNLSYE